MPTIEKELINADGFSDEDILGKCANSIEGSKYALARECFPPDSYRMLTLHAAMLQSDFWGLFSMSVMVAKGIETAKDQIPVIKKQIQEKIDEAFKVADSIRIESVKSH